MLKGRHVPSAHLPGCCAKRSRNPRTTGRNRSQGDLSISFWRWLGRYPGPHPNWVRHLSYAWEDRENHLVCLDQETPWPCVRAPLERDVVPSPCPK
eukprot:scaffold287_cov337-Pavlova_lutheri.AAC.162